MPFRIGKGCLGICAANGPVTRYLETHLCTCDGRLAAQSDVLTLQVFPRQDCKYPDGSVVDTSTAVELWHGTNFAYSQSIFADGVRAGGGHNRVGLWCRDSLAQALSWKGDPVLDRFPCVALTVLAPRVAESGPRGDQGGPKGIQQPT